jgi:3-hydroxyacyl-CoA dehydrogenase
VGQVVAVERRGKVAVVTVNNPPVNAMSQAMRQGLLDAFVGLQGDAAIDAVLLFAAGRTFVAGADLREFDTGVEAPAYYDVFALIENFSKPVVVALHGTALGAGVEVALACHYRCASKDAKLGLPELTLGIIPGAGGTQRLPRLIGAKAAAEFILGAAPVGAEAAQKLGLIDRIIEGDLLAGALKYTQELIAASSPTRPTAARSVDTAGFDDAFIKSALLGAAKRMRGQRAPEVAIEAIRTATQTSLADGLKKEKALGDGAIASNESKALRHLFFAEREVARIPGLPESVKAKNVERVGIIGAGTMGRGIAIACADAGLAVTLIDTAADALARGLDGIRATYESSVQKGRITAEQLAARLQLIQGQTQLEKLAEVDLVIEAVFESMDLKKQIFGQLGKICRKDAILASNTSTLDLNVIAASSGRPEQVVGLHFFSPANVMRLLEIVRGTQTSPEVLATAVALGKKLRKVGVVVGVCYGFVGNRMMLEGYFREADQLLLEGATVEQIDRVVENFGFAMGPWKVNDMAGNDVSTKSREAPGVRDGKPLPYHSVVDALVSAGRLGQKTSKGFYRYADGRTPLHDPEADAIIERVAKELGIQRRTISDQEVETRCIYPLINEAARILEDGIAYRASDVDVIWTTGYGFPRFRGGPLFYADTVGAKKVYEEIARLHQLHGHYWKPAALLEKLAKSGGTFSSWAPNS